MNAFFSTLTREGRHVIVGNLFGRDNQNRVVLNPGILDTFVEEHALDGAIFRHYWPRVQAPTRLTEFIEILKRVNRKKLVGGLGALAIGAALYSKYSDPSTPVEEVHAERVRETARQIMGSRGEISA